MKIVRVKVLEEYTNWAPWWLNVNAELGRGRLTFCFARKTRQREGMFVENMKVTCKTQVESRLKLFRPLCLCCFLLLNSFRFCKDPSERQQKKYLETVLLFQYQSIIDIGHWNGWIDAEDIMHPSIYPSFSSTISKHRHRHCHNHRLSQKIISRADQDAHPAWNGAFVLVDIPPFDHRPCLSTSATSTLTSASNSTLWQMRQNISRKLHLLLSLHGAYCLGSYHSTCSTWSFCFCHMDASPQQHRHTVLDYLDLRGVSRHEGARLNN